MRRYDIFEARAIKAHLTIPDAGPPTWDFPPEDVGGTWMDDALREGIVATILAAPGEAAWFYGDLTIEPQRPAEGDLDSLGSTVL
jgi:hypothetical protein